ncbi:lysophospholipase [Tistrella bauzanensis]|uniref:Lysophospholipase n=1 Tax=Tistrella arctica TaxID=3133430 RepID=A0ABU9YPE2_9PROT
MADRVRVAPCGRRVFRKGAPLMLALFLAAAAAAGCAPLSIGRGPERHDVQIEPDPLPAVAYGDAAGVLPPASLRHRHRSPEAASVAWQEARLVLAEPSSPAAISAAAGIEPVAARLQVADGTVLPMWHWRPPAGTPTRAVVIALHGFNDYRRAFALPAPVWATEGIETYAYDQRGFGQAPRAGIWPGTDALVHDLEDATRVIAARHPGLPLIWMGESMGGAVVIAANARVADQLPPEARPAGLVLVAPAVWGWSTLEPYQRWMLWSTAHIAPWLPLDGGGLDIRPSDNLAMLYALGRDPLVLKTTRADAIYGLVDLMEQATTAADHIDRPVLALYGRNEQVLPRRAVQNFRERLTAGGGTAVQIHTYPQGWHMLLRDLNAPVVWADVARWVARHGD